jgi:hypothetical protein
MWIETVIYIDVRTKGGNSVKTGAGKAGMVLKIREQGIDCRRSGRAKRIVRSSRLNVTNVRNSRLVWIARSSRNSETGARSSRHAWNDHSSRRSKTGSNDHKSTVRSGKGISTESPRTEIVAHSEPVTINHSSANASRHSAKHRNGRSSRGNPIAREDVAGDRLCSERLI